MVSVRIPVQAFAAPVIDPVKRLPGSRVRGELQASAELGWVGLAKNKVSVARQDAHVVPVLVERVLPSSCTNDADQRQFAGMHVRVAVVRLVRILQRI